MVKNSEHTVSKSQTLSIPQKITQLMETRHVQKYVYI